MKPVALFITITLMAMVCGFFIGQKWKSSQFKDGPARVIATHSGVKFEMTGITQEFARGVTAGMAMCGLFKSNGTGLQETGMNEYEFWGKYKK